MNIFIKTYHIVRSVFLLPTKIFKKQEIISEVIDVNSGDNFSSLNKTKKEKEVKKLMTYKYEIKDKYGQTIKSLFESSSKEEAVTFLTNEGYTVINIEKRKAYETDIFTGKFNAADLSFALTQLSTYIKAGIPLIDSVRILAKQSTKPEKKKVYERVVYDLVVGENFSSALENQSLVFPRLLINMVKTSEMTGDLPGTLDEMADYYDETERTRKQMLTALIYPIVVFTMAVIVISFILIWVVPSFVTMFEDGGNTLPVITQITMAASSFLGKYWIFVIIAIGVIIALYFYSFKNIKSFKKTMQTFYMKIPVIGNIIIYNEITMFTKTFASLLNHSVFITDSMEVLSKITDNEIYKEIIYKTLNTLGKGGTVSESFRGQWAVPVVAYEMILTGESTGQLGTMMEKVANYYSEAHRNAVTGLKSLIEPVTIVFLAVVVGFILLSVITPMFSMYSNVL